MGIGQHVNEEQIDRYSMESVSEDESERLEEHLLVCESCQLRVSQYDAYLKAMRTASAELRQHSEATRRTFPFRARAIAMAASLLLIGILVVAGGYLSRAPSVAPVAVALQATRGGAMAANAPSGRPLVLILNLEGLPAYSSYAVSAVNSVGTVIWKGTARPKDSAIEATLPASPAGTYFVRIYTLSGELLREYGVTLR